jgi:hypothetical protein
MFAGVAFLVLGTAARRLGIAAYRPMLFVATVVCFGLGLFLGGGQFMEGYRQGYEDARRP